MNWVPTSIIVRGPNWIGDNILALPFYRALRDVYPQAKLVWAGPESALLPSVQECFDAVRSLTGFYPAPFDLGISLPASFRAARWLYGSGARRRVGYAEIIARPFYDDYLPWPGRTTGKHKSELYLDLLRWMSHSSLKTQTPSAVRTPEKLFVIAPGASIPLREWPYFPELLIALEKKYPDHRLLLVGGETEKKWRTVYQRCGLRNTEEHFGRTSLADVEGLCRRAAVVIANDSGLAHVAATLASAPTVVLFGPGDPAYIHPRGPRVVAAFASGVPCRPCESAICRAPYGYQRCLRELSVDTVLARVAEAL